LSPHPLFPPNASPLPRSGPSQTYPKRAYRNPLDRLVGFLDDRHGDNWAIWEFRAEGTGYPDEAVYGRIRHYPWPDHHPPPFGLVPMIVAGMRNWMDGGELEGGRKRGVGEGAQARRRVSKKIKKRETRGKDKSGSEDNGSAAEEGDGALSGALPSSSSSSSPPADNAGKEVVDAATWDKSDRVVVVHCKAGKGRSGTSAVSYLIAEEGWTAEAALARFTERRMRPRFGHGVSIPSQLRTVRYVDRWANAWARANPELAAGADAATVRSHRHYVDRPVEIVEIHAWGLRNGVKLEVGGFADEGKRIEVRHVFDKEERIVVLGDAPGGGGVADMVYDMAGYGEEGESGGEAGGDAGATEEGGEAGAKEAAAPAAAPVRRKTSLIKHPRAHHHQHKHAARTQTEPPESGGAGSESSSSSAPSPAPASSSSWAASTSDVVEPGGRAVIFKPAAPIRLDHSDVLVRMERRSRAPRSVGLAMVTATAHVWFNAFFEGDGPERMARGAEPDAAGVFEIAWDALDGLKGSSRKGTRGVDRIAVVWRVVGEARDEVEPGDDEAVPQMRPADWRGEDKEEEGKETATVKEAGKFGVRQASGDNVAAMAEEDEGKVEIAEGGDSDFEGVQSSVRG
jgi:protein-tyrosine phosphatase